MTTKQTCEYHRYRDDDAEPCTGPTAEHDCSYSADIDSDGDVKRCHCCASCARECAMNI